MGYRSCDSCGNVVFPANLADSPQGRELCGYCLPTAGR
jgi:ribosomal protein S27AE